MVRLLVAFSAIAIFKDKMYRVSQKRPQQCFIILSINTRDFESKISLAIRVHVLSSPMYLLYGFH